MTIRGAIDNDPEAINAHKKNFPATTHIKYNVSELNGRILRHLLGLDNSEELTGIIGGPPCQGFSNIGNGDRNDVRNDLFVTFFKIISEVCPRFYLAENVPGIMHDKYSSIRIKALSFIQDEYIFSSTFSSKG